MSEPARLPSRPLGSTGLSTSPLGLTGSFGIGADDVERAFHELGVRYFFVTKRMEGMVAGLRRLIAAGHRDELVLAGGAMIPTGGRVNAAWASLARALGVDRIDVFHLFYVMWHWYVTGRTWPAMRTLAEQGKVAALALSCHDRPMARALCDELDLDVLMCRYNAAHRGAEEEIFATLPPTRPAVVTYTATRWGKLLGPAGGLGPMTPGECYRFVLGHERVHVALCGARSFAELRDDVTAVLAGPLSPERLAEVKLFGDRVRASATGRMGFAGR
jgi:aryl-alcohol dehydrogenase-like predicted oxidoreductase